MKRLRLAVLAALLLAVVAGVVSMVGQWWGAGELASPPAGGEARERVRVEVLNAAGIPGLARGATDRLRDAGFDVVYFGNGRGFEPESSLVLDRVGRWEVAAEVARVLEIPRVRSLPDTTLYLEATVVLGRDWAAARASSRPPLPPER